MLSPLSRTKDPNDLGPLPLKPSKLIEERLDLSLGMAPEYEEPLNFNSSWETLETLEKVPVSYPKWILDRPVHSNKGVFETCLYEPITFSHKIPATVSQHWKY